MSPRLSEKRSNTAPGSSMVVQMCLCAGLMKAPAMCTSKSAQERAFQVFYFGCISRLLLCLFYFSLNKGGTMEMVN